MVKHFTFPPVLWRLRRAAGSHTANVCLVSMRVPPCIPGANSSSPDHTALAKPPNDSMTVNALLKQGPSGPAMAKTH